MPLKLSSADIINAGKLIESGRTLTSVAKQFSINPDNLSKKVRAKGFIVGHKKGLKPCNYITIDIEQVSSDYINGESILSIHKRIGVARESIKTKLIEHGVSIRNSSEANIVSMSQMTKKQRMDRVEAAHAAMKGSKVRNETLVKIANSRKRIVGIGEQEIIDGLNAIGHPADGQTPCGKYSIDITFGNIAVEVCLNETRRLRDSDFINRCKYISDSGYHVFLLHITSKSILMHYLNKIVSDLNVFHGNPPALGQYRVVRCRFKQVIINRSNAGKLTREGMSSRPLYVSYDADF